MQDSEPKRNILITGASGFIGSFMVEEALKRGYEVWAGIRKSSSKEFISDKRIRFVELNYSNIELLSEQVKHFDYIIHCAGLTKAVRTADFERINYQYSVNLVEAVLLANNKLQKFIQMSSLSVMGMGDEDSFTPFESDETPHPNTAYGKSKLLFEIYLQQTQNVPYIILRPTGVYGPRERDYLMMIKSINNGLNVRTGKIPQQLTFIYVQDLVDATLAALESNVINKSYLLSDGKTYTDDEYAQFIKKILPKKRTINLRIPLCCLKLISYIVYPFSKITKKPSTLNPDKYRIMKQRNWKCSIEEAEKDLNFAPKFDLEKGLIASIDWYRKENWL